MRIRNGAATLENSLTVPQMMKRVVTIRPCNSTPRYIPKKNEKVCPHISLRMDVYSNTIHNNQKEEITQISVK